MRKGVVKIGLRYPPDFDGEQHLYATADEKGPIRYLRIVTETAMKPEETVMQCVRRLGLDMATKPAYQTQAEERECPQ